MGWASVPEYTLIARFASATLRGVVPLSDLSIELGGDLWADERTVVDAVVAEAQARPPAFLAEATGEWKEPFLTLRFTHGDGTVVEVTHGDGYTAVVGGGIDYHDYLDTSSAVDVLKGALRGRMTYVEHLRFGRKVAEYFEIDGQKGRLGYSRRGSSVTPIAQFVLRSIPGLPETVRKTRVGFDTFRARTVA
jgi:hypothetical protein